MKCINKWICLSLLTAVSCVSGCGKTSAAIEQPYDVYATAADFGLSSNGTAEAKSYFASDLCVSEDVAIGTDPRIPRWQRAQARLILRQIP